MPIDFKCSSCNHLIRVPDGTEGKKTMCPKCSVAQQIPNGSTPAEPETPGTGENDFSDQSNLGSGAGASDFAPDPDNPYASPETGYQPQPSSNPNDGQIHPQQADLGSIINYSMECWKENLGILVGVAATVYGTNYALGFVLQIVTGAAGQVSEELAIAIFICGYIINIVIQVFLGVGQAKIALIIARKEPVNFSELFNGGPQLLPILAAGFLFLIATLLGFVLLIIPGILIWLFFWPFYWLIVDEKRGIIESFSTAYEIGSINAGNAFIIWLLSLGIMILGLLACCLGVLFAVPLVTMLWAVAYLQMTGQIQAR